MGVTYDAGALLAAERNDRPMWAMHARFLEREVSPVVPAPVLAQAWRGGQRQASMSRLLRLCEVEAMDEAQARAVGVLARRSVSSDVVDLAVVEGAARRGDGIVTSDEPDITAIAEAVGATVQIEVV